MQTFISEIKIINLVFAIHTIPDEDLVTEFGNYIFNSSINGFSARLEL
jgi:hypothetical protein